jgi:hypothetical protein
MAKAAMRPFLGTNRTTRGDGTMFRAYVRWREVAKSANFRYLQFPPSAICVGLLPVLTNPLNAFSSELN